MAAYEIVFKGLTSHGEEGPGAREYVEAAGPAPDEDREADDKKYVELVHGYDFHSSGT